jgi:hypothetical protein
MRERDYQLGGRPGERSRACPLTASCGERGGERLVGVEGGRRDDNDLVLLIQLVQDVRDGSRMAATRSGVRSRQPGAGTADAKIIHIKEEGGGKRYQ